jgi:hypothetical protein
VAASDLIRRLPEIPVVRDRCRSMAMLDAILSPEWENRYFSFDSRWSPAEEMAAMRDGSGNEYSIVFSPAGAYARGFDHESSMTPYRVTPPAPWPGLLDGVPEVFRPQVTEPAFSDGATYRATVCFWREQADTAWRAGDIEPLPEGMEDDGSAEWLFDVLLDGRPERYQQFAEEYSHRATGSGLGSQPRQGDLHEPVDGSAGWQAARRGQGVQAVAGEFRRSDVIAQPAVPGGRRHQLGDQVVEVPLRGDQVVAAVQQRT